nr:formate dehydrogenase subunit gamma [uncultured Roseateles sp.]
MRKALTLILLLSWALLGPAQAADPAASAPAGAPVLSAAPEPKPEDTNAQRAKSQPGNNAPMWRAVRESGNTQGYSSLPAAESGTLIQSFVQYPGSRYTTAGEAWRQVRNRWLIPYGGSLVLIVFLAIALFYWRKGPLETHAAPTGRMIERFTALERSAHWTVAISFSILAISGLVMMFGKFVLLPVLGGSLLGWLSYALKTLHNFVGPLFSVGLLLLIAIFIKDNLPRAYDMQWLRSFGGLISKSHVPSHRFNAGEKILFWTGVLGLGLLISASGLALDHLFPGIEFTRRTMQIAHLLHATAAVLMMSMFLGHIYMGTLGVKGAYSAMRDGQVDESWAKEHHEYWYDDVKAGRIPAQRSAAASTAVPLQAGGPRAS